MAGYSVTYTVVDEATKKIEEINKRITQLSAPLRAQEQALRRLGASLSKLVDVTGLKAVAEGFQHIARSALEAAASITRIVPGMAALTGAATLAGLAKMVNDFAELSRTLTITGQELNKTPEALSGAQQAMRSIGGDVTAATNSLVELNAAMHDAAYGLNPIAARTFAQLGVSTLDANRNFRDSIDVQTDLFKAVDRLRDPFDRLRFIQRAAGADTVKTYQSIKAAGISVDDWNKRQREMQTLSNEDVKVWFEYHEALSKLNSSFYQLALRIGGAVAPAFTGLFKTIGDYVDKHKDELNQGIKDFGDELIKIPWAKVGKGMAYIAKSIGDIYDAFKKTYDFINSIADSDVGKFLLQPRQMPGTPGFQPEIDQPKGSWLWGWIQRNVFGQTAPAGPGRQGMVAPGAGGTGGAPPENLAGISGISGTEAAALASIGGPESRWRNITNFRFDPTHTAQGYYQITDTNWRRYAPALGIDAPNATAASFADQSRVAAAMLRREGGAPWDVRHGGPLPVGWYFGIRQGQSQDFGGGAVRPPITRAMVMPPGLPVNSRGETYASSLNTMSAQERANNAASMAWIKANMGNPAAFGAPPAARGPAANLVPGGALTNGAVDITVTHKNAPTDVSLTAASTGNGVNLSPPRTERVDFGQP